MTAHHQPDHSPAQETQLDEWHQHTRDEGLPQKEHAGHANITALLIIFVVITVSTVVFSVGIGLFAINQMNLLKAKGEVAGLQAVAEQAAAYKRDALAAQSGNMDRAMQTVVAEYREMQSK
ncbi:MAG: hypothetical protein K8E66_00330 [Phycisphaerales bacterium]|nr:hypothetical protein [Phycisphaerales bacterium]